MNILKIVNFLNQNNCNVDVNVNTDQVCSAVSIWQAQSSIIYTAKQHTKQRRDFFQPCSLKFSLVFGYNYTGNFLNDFFLNDSTTTVSSLFHIYTAHYSPSFFFVHTDEPNLSISSPFLFPSILLEPGPGTWTIRATVFLLATSVRVPVSKWKYFCPPNHQIPSCTQYILLLELPHGKL